VPQIEITYEVDANGILQVSAVEKSSGKSEKITITNDSSRLNKEDIEKMLKEAEKFKDDDEKIRKQFEAKNNLESYCYNVKSNVLNDNKLKSTLGSDFNVVDKLVETTLKWVDDNPNLSASEFEDKHKEIESQLTPLITKAYQTDISSGMPSGMPSEMPSEIPSEIFSGMTPGMFSSMESNDMN
jgi:heat shock 70kDa protein 1/2/6/8